MNPSRISIIIPVHNGEAYIVEAVDSILKQDHSDLEVLVIDDGSTDRTRDSLARFEDRIRVLSQENRGQSAARNAGVRAATGGLIGFLDADDIWTDDHLALMLPHLDETEPYDFVRGHTRFIRMTEEGLESSEPLFMEALVGACLYRRGVLDAVGPFDESMRAGEDFDWSIRLAESGSREKRLSEATLLYRRHDANLTNSKAVTEKGQLHAFRNKLRRMRSRI